MDVEVKRHEIIDMNKLKTVIEDLGDNLLAEYSRDCTVDSVVPLILRDLGYDMTNTKEAKRNYDGYLTWVLKPNEESLLGVLAIAYTRELSDYYLDDRMMGELSKANMEVMLAINGKAMKIFIAPFTNRDGYDVALTDDESLCLLMKVNYRTDQIKDWFVETALHDCSVISNVEKTVDALIEHLRKDENPENAQLLLTKLQAAIESYEDNSSLTGVVTQLRMTEVKLSEQAKMIARLAKAMEEENRAKDEVIFELRDKKVDFDRGLIAEVAKELFVEMENRLPKERVYEYTSEEEENDIEEVAVEGETVDDEEVEETEEFNLEQFSWAAKTEEPLLDEEETEDSVDNAFEKLGTEEVAISNEEEPVHEETATSNGEDDFDEEDNDQDLALLNSDVNTEAEEDNSEFVAEKEEEDALEYEDDAVEEIEETDDYFLYWLDKELNDNETPVSLGEEDFKRIAYLKCEDSYFEMTGSSHLTTCAESIDALRSMSDTKIEDVVYEYSDDISEEHSGPKMTACKLKLRADISKSDVTKLIFDLAESLGIDQKEVAMVWEVDRAVNDIPLAPSLEAKHELVKEIDILSLKDIEDDFENEIEELSVVDLHAKLPLGSTVIGLLEEVVKEVTSVKIGEQEFNIADANDKESYKAVLWDLIQRRKLSHEKIMKASVKIVGSKDLTISTEEAEVRAEHYEMVVNDVTYYVSALTKEELLFALCVASLKLVSAHCTLDMKVNTGWLKSKLRHQVSYTAENYVLNCTARVLLD